MTDTIRQLLELKRHVDGALAAAERGQPELAYALLDTVSLGIQTPLRALRLQSVDKWAHAREQSDAA